jgi:hypothetical protein
MGVGYGTGNIGKIIGPLGLAVIVGNFVKPEATLGAIVPALLYLAFCGVLAARLRDQGALDRRDRRDTPTGGASVGSGQPSPATVSRCSVSRTVDGARFSRRAISLLEIPAVLKRSTSRTWRIAVLSAGIRPLRSKAEGGP